MHTTIVLLIIAQVIVMGAILIGIYHEKKLIAFEDRVFAALKARHVKNKRARAKAYLRSTEPAVAKPAPKRTASAARTVTCRDIPVTVKKDRPLRVIKGGKFTDAA